MFVIETNGYDTSDKVVISKTFLIPTIEKTLKLNKNDIIIEDDVLIYMIEKKTGQEKGVRNLKRTLEIIFNRLNLYTLMEPDSKLFNETIIKNIQFPFRLTKNILDTLVQSNKDSFAALHMYL